MPLPLRRCFPPLLSLLAAASATAQESTAWAWVNPFGQPATFTPAVAYQYCSSGGTITVARVAGSQNRFVVHVPGIDVPRSHVQATAHGGNHVAVIEYWRNGSGDTDIQIATYQPTGQPANNVPFTVWLRTPGDPDERAAYLWANDESRVSYTAPFNYAWNGGRQLPWINRAATGLYYVYLYDLANNAPERGHVQVTAYGSFRRFKIWSVGHDFANGHVLVALQCFDAAGNLADGRFVLHYNEAAAPIDERLGSGAHVLSDDPLIGCHRPDPLFADSNGLEGPPDDHSICRIGTGNYLVQLPDVAPSSSSTAIATAYGGSSTEYASIGNWGTDGCGGTTVQVRTWDVAGNPADARFSLLYLTNRPAIQRKQAWAWVNPFNKPPVFVPDQNYSYNSEGAWITAETYPTIPNRHKIRIPDMAGAPGVPLVSAHGALSPEVAVVHAWWEEGADVIVDVETFEHAGTPAIDGMFTLHYRSGGAGHEREAYVYAHQPTASGSYTPVISWNGDRGTPTVTRLSTGRYRVSVPGLTPLGAERGNVQVTTKNQVPIVTRVESWSSNPLGLDVIVACQNSSGAEVPSQFIMSYSEFAGPIPGREGSGAHVWADNATASSYTPNPDYTDSNGTFGPNNAETITRLAAGLYEVFLPNLVAIDSVNVQVSAYGSGSHFPVIRSFGSLGSGPTSVVVEIWDTAGNLTDGRFTLQYLTDRPNLLPATSSGLGSGCNGPTLTPMSKPALCRPWELFLDDLPTASTLGFLQLGLSNPGLPLGSGAPGCTQYTDGAVTILLLLPHPSPLTALSVPNDPSFVDLVIYAQGGAFVPGINPFGLAASNGAAGVIGH
ncbi:MAG: hypothetical protein NXI31_15285 [bacterium]|nr:hypothetical protein [bacterium]